MRRELCREATGPTPEEFAAEGATFLVGMIRAAHPNRLAPQYAVTPRDDWFYPYAYVDDLGILTGALFDNLFGQDKTPEQVQAETAYRERRKAFRAESRAEDEARVGILVSPAVEHADQPAHVEIIVGRRTFL